MSYMPVTTNNSNIRLGNCEVCDSKESKYKCPRCEVKTCSLNCVKIHKIELQCSGVRDKTLYKPLSKFSNLDLLSDYRLLEDISRSVQKYHKDVSKRWTRFQTTLPIQLYKLRGAAFARGVRLLFLPQNFEKHKNNTTYYDWKTKSLFWKIEWIFFGGEDKVKFVDKRVLDTEKLGSTITKYLQVTNQDPNMERFYAVGFSGITLLLKAEKTSDKYYELNLSLSLRENLKRKTIIEYPTLLVILKYQKDEYDFVDSDDEMQKERTISNKECEIQIIEKE